MGEVIEPEHEVVTRLRRAYELFNRGEFDAAVEAGGFDPSFVFHPPFGSDPVIGLEAYRAWMEPDALESLKLEPSEFRVAGDKVLVIHRSTARGAGSGIELTLDSWTVWTIGESGAIVRLNAFLGDQEAEAYRLAGLPQ